MTTDYWQAENYAQHGGFVSALHRHVLADLAPTPGEHILDLGCGDGEIADIVTQLGCTVIGLDSSADLIAKAKLRGIDAILGDAQRLTFDRQFDAVISNAAMHWMHDQQAVCNGVFKALKAGGRFVAEMGGFGNIAKIEIAIGRVLTKFGYDFMALNPWVFPTAETQRLRLSEAGFHVQKSELRARPTILPTNIGGWLDTFANAIFAHVNEHHRADIKRHIIHELEPQLKSEDGNWVADYMRLNFVAVKPN